MVYPWVVSGYKETKMHGSFNLGVWAGGYQQSKVFVPLLPMVVENG